MRALPAVFVCILGFAIANGCKKPEEATSDEASPKPKKTKPTADVVAKAPARHRDNHESCASDDTPAPTKSTFKRMPTVPGSPCTTKADCKDKPNGRCGEGHCAYDACYRDSDCKAGGPCTCETSGARGYYCAQGNCSVDADCGSNGFCSPSWSSTCGAFFGVVGWYCHGPEDECVSDTDCVSDSGTGYNHDGYCAYSPDKKHWICGFGHCAG